MRNQNTHRLAFSIRLLFPLLTAFLISITLIHGTVHAASPLSVSITAPSNNAVVGTGTQVAVTASVSVMVPTITISRVEFSLRVNGGDGTILGTATTAPYGIIWSIQPSQAGTAMLTAKAFDRLGRSAISQPVTVFVAILDPLPLLR